MKKTTTKCQICSKALVGRKDAKTCSVLCRKKLQFLKQRLAYDRSKSDQIGHSQTVIPVNVSKVTKPELVPDIDLQINVFNALKHTLSRDVRAVETSLDAVEHSEDGYISDTSAINPTTIKISSVKHQTKKTTAKCQVCHKDFFGRRDAKTCSVLCRKRLQLLVKKSQIVPNENTPVVSSKEAKHPWSFAWLVPAFVSLLLLLGGGAYAALRAHLNGIARTQQATEQTQQGIQTAANQLKLDLNELDKRAVKLQLNTNTPQEGSISITGDISAANLQNIQLQTESTSTTIGGNGQPSGIGPAGTAGVNGTNGTNGINGVDGAAGATGPQGPAGTAGASGANGANGTNGTNGTNGPTGATGATGATGPQGPSGVATCPNGVCLSLQAATPGVAETGSLNITGTAIANSFSGSGTSLTSLNATNISSGTVADARLTTNVTLQGNSFNGVSQLVQLTAGGILPVISGANLTNLTGANVTGNISGNAGTATALASNPTDCGANSYAITIAANGDLTCASITDASLSTNVTLQGNSFNGTSQLVQTTAGGLLPVLSGANLTTLNGTNISSGTVADARLSTNVTLQGNSFNGVSQLVQLTAGGILPVLNGSNLTNLSVASCAGCIQLQGSTPGIAQTGHLNITGTTIAGSFSGSGTSLTSLNATNLASGTVADARLTTNVTLQGNSFNGASQLVQLTVGGILPVLDGSNLTNIAASSCGGCVQLQGATPGVAQTGHLNITGTAIAGTFSGSGASLTSLNGSNISSGTVADARLSANVALLNGTGPQTFTGNNKFTGTILQQNASNSTTAFQIQDQAGTSNLLVADTTNSKVGIATAPSSTGDALQVTGSASATTGFDLAATGNSSSTITKSMIVSSAVTANDVVIIDTANAGKVTTTNVGGSNKVFGIATSTQGSTNQTQNIVIGGIYQVTADTGAIAIGDSLITSTTTGQVSASSSGAAGSVIGRALSAKAAGSSGLVWAQITPGQGGSNTGNSNSIGTITPFAGSSAPSGWLLTDGSAVSRTTYADLFALIGTTYGVGDGSTTFNLPDLRGRGPVGLDNMGGSDAGRLNVANTLGGSGGEQLHTQTIAEMPAHTHDPNVRQSSTEAAGYGLTITGAFENRVEVNGGGSITTTSTGGGQAFNVMDPYLLTNYIIRATNSGSGNMSSLQGGYDGGNTLTTTDARDVSITLANTTTDSNFILNVATSSTSKVAVQANGTDTFSVSATGAVLSKNSADSTTAFRIQNAAGNNYMLVNTSGASVSMGDTGIASTVQVGNTTGAVAQTVNVGNNATASSTTTLTLGNLLGTSTTTVQGGSGNINLVSGGNVVIGTSDTTGTLLVLDTKTGSGDPTGVNGGMYYNSNAGKFRCYENGAWYNCLAAHGAWTAWTPTVTAASGTITTVGATACSYMRTGRTIVWRCNITITTNGTGASFLIFTLPAAWGTAQNVGGGQNGDTAKSVDVIASGSSTQAYVSYYDATYPVTSGATLYMNGSYEASTD